jgi:hypothetical protein
VAPDLSTEQRGLMESLLGRALSDDEGLNIQPSQVLQEAPVGERRGQAYQQYLADLDQLSQRASSLPEDQVDALIDQACNHVRHS